MTQPAAPQLFPEHPAPDSAARRRFRALARSAPWLSTSLRLELDVPPAFAQHSLSGTLGMILRGREAIAISDESDTLRYQRELFTADRGRDYVAATESSWKLPASLTYPVYTNDHLISRRPDIDGYQDLLPLDFLASMLDPFELAGTEPASLDLAFEHPTYIHELAPTRSEHGRAQLSAVLTAGHSYQPSSDSFTLVPAGSTALLVLDLDTGICVERRLLDGSEPPLRIAVLAKNEYYIDSLFTVATPTMTDVRAHIPWTVRAQR